MINYMRMDKSVFLLINIIVLTLFRALRMWKPHLLQNEVAEFAADLFPPRQRIRTAPVSVSTFCMFSPPYNEDRETNFPLVSYRLVFIYDIQKSPMSNFVICWQQRKFVTFYDIEIKLRLWMVWRLLLHLKLGITEIRCSCHQLFIYR